MAKKQFLDMSGLEVVANNIPKLAAGKNVTLTPDKDKANKITISSPILDKAAVLTVIEGYNSLVFDGKEVAYKDEVNQQIEDLGEPILGFANLEAFPAEGEEGKLYIDESTNSLYRWSGTEYVKVGGSDVAVKDWAKVGSSIEVATSVPEGAVFTDTTYEVATTTTDGLLSSTDKATYDAMYTKPATGIPRTDFDEETRIAIGNAKDLTDKVSVVTVGDVEYLAFNGSILADKVETELEIENGKSVKEYENKASFPTTGTEDFIYIDKATNNTYRWDTTESKYVQVGGSGGSTPSPTGKIDLVLQNSEPTEYIPGMVWIDGSSTRIDVYTFKYQSMEPSDAETGCGWVG